MSAFGQQASVFRAARLADLDAIVALEAAEFAHLAYPYFILRQLFELHGPHWLIAEHEGRVCGYVLTALGRDGTAWFLGFAVAGYCRGRGYGRSLLETALEQCRAQRIDQVFVTVRPGNQTAYHLYKEVGFVWAEHEMEYFGPDEPRDVLVHKLYH
ncbi:GNAT family N-acetyltransferase [Nocardia acidivorans]|uniref:GNAT family N-acetyltransferase n=1 Tax=Nocardia acidivorans TaxID=404580 RepID=UPI0008376A93|nr:GNAT family N-acetyltransferase [Nocardia acidivorans]